MPATSSTSPSRPASASPTATSSVTWPSWPLTPAPVAVAAARLAPRGTPHRVYAIASGWQLRSGRPGHGRHADAQGPLIALRRVAPCNGPCGAGSSVRSSSRISPRSSMVSRASCSQQGLIVACLGVRPVGWPKPRENSHPTGVIRQRRGPPSPGRDCRAAPCPTRAKE